MQFNTLVRSYYLVISVGTLIATMIGGIILVELGLRTYVFSASDKPEYTESCIAPMDPYAYGDPALRAKLTRDEIQKSEENYKIACEQRVAQSFVDYKNRKGRTAARSIATLIIALPLFALHFKALTRTKKAEDVA